MNYDIKVEKYLFSTSLKKVLNWQKYHKRYQQKTIKDGPIMQRIFFSCYFTIGPNHAPYVSRTLKNPFWHDWRWKLSIRRLKYRNWFFSWKNTVLQQTLKKWFLWLLLLSYATSLQKVLIKFIKLFRRYDSFLLQY